MVVEVRRLQEASRGTRLESIPKGLQDPWRTSCGAPPPTVVSWRHKASCERPSRVNHRPGAAREPNFGRASWVRTYAMRASGLMRKTTFEQASAAVRTLSRSLLSLSLLPSLFPLPLTLLLLLLPSPRSSTPLLAFALALAALSPVRARPLSFLYLSVLLYFCSSFISLNSFYAM